MSLLDEEHNISVGTTIATVEANLMHATLKSNVDLFAWTPSDMPRLSLDIITHKLSVFKEAQMIAQKKKKDYGVEKRLAAKEEAQKLLSAGFICEARYTTWLANVIIVTKPNIKEV